MNETTYKLPDPGRIVVAGDWHGSTRWATTVIHEAGKILTAYGEQYKVIVQLGDFGIGDWGQPGTGDVYLEAVNDACELADCWLLFADGNHEDHDLIASWREPGYPALAACQPKTARGRMPRVFHLPRGHRWTWNGRTWLACGGAASPDREFRETWEKANGEKTWWQQEYITQADVDACVTHGPADVLVSHDRPAEAPISLPPWPRGWAEADLARCEASRDMISAIVHGTGVQHVMHGHYHEDFQTAVLPGLTVTQLGIDAMDNYRVLDTRTMEWESVPRLTHNP